MPPEPVTPGLPTVTTPSESAAYILPCPGSENRPTGTRTSGAPGGST